MLSNSWKPVGRPSTPIWKLGFSRFFSFYRANQETKEGWAKLKLDPEKYRRVLNQKLKYYSDRYAKDPEFRNRKQSTNRIRYREHWKTSEQYRRGQAVHRWASRYTWFREQLPWKTHRPLLYPEAVEHQCASCGASRKGGSRLWWTSSGSESHTCHACYAKSDRDQMMPEGYEDCRTVKDLTARMKQLNHSEVQRNQRNQRNDHSRQDGPSKGRG